jgi:hypothetical protein
MRRSNTNLLDSNSYLNNLTQFENLPSMHLLDKPSKQLKVKILGNDDLYCG